MDKENDILTEEKNDETAENPSEEAEKAPDNGETEETPVYRRKTVTVSDVITLQAILCVLLSIAYMAVNMLFPQTAEEMYSEYKANITAGADENAPAALAEKIVELLNSTPREYDRADT